MQLGSIIFSHTQGWSDSINTIHDQRPSQLKAVGFSKLWNKKKNLADGAMNSAMLTINF